jgi:hypothetical protein
MMLNSNNDKNVASYSRYFVSVTFNLLLLYRKSTYMLSCKLCISYFENCIVVLFFGTQTTEAFNGFSFMFCRFYTIPRSSDFGFRNLSGNISKGDIHISYVYISNYIFPSCREYLRSFTMNVRGKCIDIVAVRIPWLLRMCFVAL